MERKVICLLVIAFLLVTGCNNETTKEWEEIGNKINNSTPTTTTRPSTNYKVGDLSFYIPDTLRLNGTSTDTTKAFEIYKDDTNITVWVSQKKNISESIEEFIKNDYSSDVKLDHVEYNNHKWYVVPNGEFRLYTKYNNDVYKIRFSVLEDKNSYVNELKRVIPKSLVFEGA